MPLYRVWYKVSEWLAWDSGGNCRQTQLVKGDIGQHEDLGAAAFLLPIDTILVRGHLTMRLVRRIHPLQGVFSELAPP